MFKYPATNTAVWIMSFIVKFTEQIPVIES